MFRWKDGVQVMGIVNVTPDSFSGDGLVDAAAAIDHGLRLAAEGADILDLGGESTRPGHDPVPAREEMRRVLPVVEALARESGLPVSIDTSKEEVAAAALAAGAVVVNDVWGLQRSPGMAGLAARAGAGLVLMHNQDGTAYGDLIGDVIASLQRSVAIAEAAGVSRESIAVDPGIGFGKTAEQNLEVLRRLEDLGVLGLPILVGTSRKSFLGRLFRQEGPDRLYGTAASVAVAILRGARIVRVHDVRAMAMVTRVAEALR